MRKLLLFHCAFVFAWSNASSQTFNGTGGFIPDFDSLTHPVYFPCTVSGLPNYLDSTFGLERVVIDNLTHSYIGDLNIVLISPDQRQTELSFRRGGGGNNFVATNFRGHGANGLISDLANIAPYTGEYDPDGELSMMNDGIMYPNGIWQILIVDMAANDTGTIWNWHLVFGSNPTPPIVMPCGTTDATLCQCPDGTQDCDLIPDMTSSYACIMNDHSEVGNQFFIGNATPNIGWGPLEIHGTGNCFCDTVLVNCTDTCPGGSSPKELVEQTIYHKHDWTMTSYTRPAGTMTYHPTHGHIHLDSWAHYSLRRPKYGLQPPDWPIIGTGNKQSYCLINLGDCTGNNGYCVDSLGATITMADIPNAPMGSVTGCGHDQGIFTGKLDIYSSSLNGQWVDLPVDICNGDYYIVSITDPENVILETNDNNNWVAVPVTLGAQLNLPFPTCDFTYTSAGNVIHFYNSSTDFSSLLWDFGDGFTDVLPNPSHTYTNSGTYTVILTATNQCGFTEKVASFTITLTGVYPVQTEDIFAIKVFPNPAKDMVKVDFSLSKRCNVSASLLDVNGKKISVLTDGMKDAGSYHYVIDAAQLELANGIYTLQFTSDEKNINQRITIIR